MDTSNENLKKLVAKWGKVANFSTEFLQIGAITTGMNGYPKGDDDKFIYGFDDFEELVSFAEFHKIEICLFKKRAGWRFWENLGKKYEPLTVYDYMQSAGDDCYKIDLDNDIIKEQLHDLADNFDGDFSILELYISETLQKLEAVEVAGEGFTAIVNGCEIKAIGNEMLSYSSDVWTYQLGALFTEMEF
ncbi:MAG: hypothetical protein WC994_09915 [Brumimicrobium sp.]